MKKVIVGIFAHPDDEAFGPSATLLLETQTGSELHLVTLTAGEAGVNPDNLSDLGAERLNEWRSAGQLMGAASLQHLGYADGTLSNGDHVAIAQQIESIVHAIVAARSDVEVELMSTDLNGVTGHIDHIVAGRSACLAFYRLQASGLPVTRVRLSCVPRQYITALNTDFVLMEPGRDAAEIDEVIDARHLGDSVREIIRCHYTQRGDGEALISRLGETIGMNYFIVRT